MNLLNPATLQQQLELYTLKTSAENFLCQHSDFSYRDNFLQLVNNIAPEISGAVAHDMATNAAFVDTNTQVGLNTYLRMFYLSLPFDTSEIREYIMETDYQFWVRYFVNILLFSYIEFYRGYRNEH